MCKLQQAALEQGGRKKRLGASRLLQWWAIVGTGGLWWAIPRHSHTAMLPVSLVQTQHATSMQVSKQLAGQ